MAGADARQDSVGVGAEVAIRLGELDDSVFGARKLETLESMLVASPVYLKTRGIPKTPADLSSHDCVFGPGNFGRDNWSFHRNGTETSVDVRGRIHTNSGPGVFASVMAGLGIAMMSTVMAGTASKNGGPGGLVPALKIASLSMP